MSVNSEEKKRRLDGTYQRGILSGRHYADLFLDTLSDADLEKYESEFSFEKFYEVALAMSSRTGPDFMEWCRGNADGMIERIKELKILRQQVRKDKSYN